MLLSCLQPQTQHILDSMYTHIPDPGSRTIAALTHLCARPWFQPRTLGPPLEHKFPCLSAWSCGSSTHAHSSCLAPSDGSHGCRRSVCLPDPRAAMNLFTLTFYTSVSCDHSISVCTSHTITNAKMEAPWVGSSAPSAVDPRGTVFSFMPILQASIPGPLHRFWHIRHWCQANVRILTNHPRAKRSPFGHDYSMWNKKDQEDLRSLHSYAICKLDCKMDYTKWIKYLLNVRPETVRLLV